MQIETKNGYTLIELLVAMTLFVTAFALVNAAFVSALKTQREIVALISANDNVITSMEQINREIRTGIDFSGGGDSLTFTNARGEAVAYRLINNRIERGVGGNFFAITANNVRITRLNFIRTQPAGFPLRVTIIVQINPVGKDLEQIFVNMQTTVSPRIIF
ncbi:hypothetical protein A3A20_00450 [Candidatus Wolfebacteria bacterium RIFCSPLOWO2_01_FULL_45_19]|uniref:Prepilin-type N-terminal cleavage/methylation domain-containing protein n=1 Tax=Candidatus Wolfebacteria bacterium RIFCSPLOWO2_01_FULL_45_19 TaxID=1802557 RepID=A0A1F8DRJ6_9BACT|nr:MAG: hypothetical protein UX23_C0013G0007 [Parcubacteria group bacterium GW2011_GWB1_45_9]OGM91052.1 MAG: hypothetical protein A3A20_00450 [Candidatus Wolfebacteria bacterium RIFCSPLOWO2_01_FULL_45_19]